MRVYECAVCGAVGVAGAVGWYKEGVSGGTYHITWYYCPEHSEFVKQALDAEMKAASMAGSANESPNSKTNGEGDARDLEESR